MSHNRPPRMSEYDSLDDYEEAMQLWEWAEDDYADDYMERRREERYSD